MKTLTRLLLCAALLGAALSARADVADAESESAMADVDEADSHARYKEASERAAGRGPKT